MFLNLIFGLLIFIGFELFLIGINTIKNKSYLKNIEYNKLIASGVFFIIIELIFLILIHVIFKDVETKGILGFSFIAGVFSIAINPYNIYLRFKNKDFKVKKPFIFKLSIIAIVIVLVEVFCFNSLAYSNYDSVSYYNMTECSIKWSSYTEITDDLLIEEQNDYIAIEANGIDYNNIHFIFKGDESESITIDVMYIKNGSSEYTFYNKYYVNPIQDESCFLGLNGIDDASVIRFNFTIDDSRTHSRDIPVTVILDGIVLNDNLRFNFNIFRVSIIFGLFALFLSLGKIINKMTSDDAVLLDEKSSKFQYIKPNNVSNIQKWVVALGVFSLLVVIIISVINSDYFYTKYSSINLEKTNIYFQQFDAFLKGQLHIDIKPSDKLLALENPYDPANRGGVYYLWDHALYNGKYYSYYGAAPIFLVMFPIYFVSGYLPNPITMQLIGMVLTATFMLLAISELYKLISKKQNVIVLLFMMFIALFTSLVFYVTYKVGLYYEGIYHIPYAFGLAFCFAYIFFTIKAYKEESKRMLWLGLTGLSFVLMVASRPNLALTIIFMLPFFIKMIFGEGKWKKKILDFVPCASILLVGAILICTFNYLRFENIMEFGQFYQLTVTDGQALEITDEAIYPTFLHYFLQEPYYNFHNGFPFLTVKSVNYGVETHSYVRACVGIFSVPMFILILLIPFIFKKDNKEVKWMMYLLPIIIFVIALSTYCYAGVCPRYLLDLFPFATLASVMVIFKLLDKYNSKRALSILIPILTIICLYSAFFTFGLLFNNFDGVVIGDARGIVLDIKQFFLDYNLN